MLQISFQEYIVQGPERNLAEILGEISENISKNKTCP